jgi:hypothetical protein
VQATRRDALERSSLLASAEIDRADRGLIDSIKDEKPTTFQGKYGRYRGRMVRKLALVLALVLVRCSSSGGDGEPDAQTDANGGSDSSSDVISSDGGASDAATNPMGLSCATTTQTIAPSACPAPSGAANQVSFCFRAQFAGATSVDVYGGFGQAMDWKSPFVTLKGDGTGTFTGATSLANGSYPYLFKVTGASDGLFKNATWFLDQESSQFMPPPTGSPLQRSVPVVTVPQGAPPALHHLRGKVVYGGAPQPCFPLQIDVGELYKDGGSLVLSEQGPANMAESAADGTFDFPVASAEVMTIVRYPFFLSGLDAGYPDPMTTPSIGYARVSTAALGGSDVTLDPAEVSYPHGDYAAMAPANGNATLPTTFTYSVLPQSSSASFAVIGTNIAGNDPLYWSAYGSTSMTWDGGLNGTQGSVKLGTQYWWGTWQKRSVVDAGTSWSEESLLFPITFQ